MSGVLRKLVKAAGRAQRRGLKDATRAFRQAMAASVSIAAAGAPAPRPKAKPRRASSRPAVPAKRERSSAWTPTHRAASAPGAWPPGFRVALEPAARTAPARPDDAAGRFSEGRFTELDGTRSFKLFEPDGFEAGGRLPLVVMLHGCTQSADDFAAGTRMNRLAQERGFHVLYPQQAPRSNANKCWNWFVPADQRRGSGEPALLAALTRQVIATHRIDADRVYVAGLSAGGAMAAILAREYPDIYAAAGVHSGLQAGAAHDVGSAFEAMRSGTTLPSTGGSRPRKIDATVAASASAPGDSLPHADADASTGAGCGAPLIVFHGDADSTVHAANGAHVVDSALGDARWIAERSVDLPATGRRGSTRIVYRAASSGIPSRTEHWVVHGAAHAWSGGDASGSFTDPRGPDASREMLRFFFEHPRVRSPATS
ncbi:MAG TPA: PHB depolymerase family esterase [Caldimonas sp.]|nr:PHB depolymerase family esterase [Caldimonas sp.]